MNLGKIAAVLLGSCLVPLLAQAEEASPGTTFSFTLQYVEKGTSPPLDVNMGKQEVKFRKEPDFGKDQVVRRALVVGSGANDFIGFAVDITKLKLYLDLNRNLDLTDDPQGVFQGKGSPPYPFFQDVPVTVQSNGTSRAYLMNQVFIESTIDGYFSVGSSYQGEIELAGQKWRLELKDNLDGRIDGEDRFVIELAGGTTGYNPMPVPKNLFLGGRLYRLGFTFAPGPRGPLTANFTEVAVPAGELVLDGQFIRRLVLSAEDRLVILESPGRLVSVPIDEYGIETVYLKDSGKTLLSSSDVRELELSVSAGPPQHLCIGGPLESTVTASSYSNFLQLDYLLKGAAGEKYSAVNPDRANPPKVAIHGGGRLLGAGNFSYG